MGATNPAFCVLMALAGFLEGKLSKGLLHPRYLFGDTNQIEDAERTKDKYARKLRDAWNTEIVSAVLALTNGSIGTHSIRKFASTWAVEMGCSYNDVEIRGRWKGGTSGRIVNRYISLKQLPTDGKVAEKLCVGGPVKYKLREDSDVSREFLQGVVVPHIAAFYANSDTTNKVADVLSLPLLHACFDASAKNVTTSEVCNRIIDGYRELQGNDYDEGYNPVEKVPLLVHRVENQLAINELVDISNGTGTGGGGAGTSATKSDNGRLADHWKKFSKVRIFWGKLVVLM